jgi:hypothetical protein
MKIKNFSWILASAYLLCGILCFLILTKFELLLSQIAVPLPALTRIVLAVGPSGSLCLMVTIGLMALLKDLKFQSPALGPIFTIVLAMLAGCILVGLLMPCFPLVS